MEATTTLYGFETRSSDGRCSDRSGSYDIKRLWQRNHEILGLALQGFDNKKIAALLGLSEATVSNTLNSTLGKEKLAEMRQERDSEFVNVSKEVSRLAEKALQAYEAIFDSPNASPNLKKETADTVLMDLGGHRAPTKIDSAVHIKQLNESKFKRRGLEQPVVGMLVEVKGETVKQ
jgi:DNA-binding CsgD family transcriptional regulator